jgi:plastocyanin
MNHFSYRSPVRLLVPLLAVAVVTVLVQAALAQSRPQMMGMSMSGPSSTPRPQIGGVPSVGAGGPGRMSYGNRGGTGYSSMGYSSMGYGNRGSMGYRSSGGQGQMQGSGGGGSFPGARGQSLETQPYGDERRPRLLLTAVGVPNEDGKLRWPPVLYAMASPGTEEHELREQIDAIFAEMVNDATRETVRPALLDELGDMVEKLRKLVFRDRPERVAFSQAEWNDSERFLKKLDHARLVLQRAYPAEGEAQLATRDGPSEVAVRDNSFEPKTITVPAGTTVRWTSYGSHRHTVAADDGSWGQKELEPHAIYSHTFTEPGTYSYHCAIHPESMRGTIIVK